MADPSLMLSSTGLDWLERDASARETLVVPRTFVDWFNGGIDLPAALMSSPEDAKQLANQRSRIEAMMRGVPSFSHEDVALARVHEEVRAMLLLEAGPLAELYADEWAFLQSQSTLLSKLRLPIDAFRDAGAIIVEVGRKTGIRLVERVIPKESLPQTFTREVLAKAAAKWIVLGGATVGGGTLGGVVGTAFAGPAVGGALGAKVGGFAAGAATNAALLAIDP